MAMKPRASTELLIPKKWSDERAEISPERRKKWIEPNSTRSVDRKVAVIYYLSRNGHLEHPHFIEVPLSSSNGLYLKDVINRLSSLRGHGMADLYSWSSKRSYKNRYVWQDLSENDLIHPTDGHDYILKGSELLQTTTTETASLRTNKYSSDCNNLDEDQDASSSSTTALRLRKNQSWSSFENNAADDRRREYVVVYKCESSRDFAAAADAATQTEEEKRRKSGSFREKRVEAVHGNKSVELSREELSPPPSMSSSDGSDGVSGTGDVERHVNVRDRTADEECDSSGKMKALMQLITCGSSLGLKQFGPMKNKESKIKAQFNR